MKHIKFRILAIIWSAIFLLFVAFCVILNVTMPAHFEKEAAAALNYEIEYMDKLVQQNKDMKLHTATTFM